MENEVFNYITKIAQLFTSNEPQSTAIIMSTFAQLFLIIAVLYAIYKKFIKGTSSEKLVKGIFILIFAWFMGEVLSKIHLHILGGFLKVSITVIAISLVIIFQPELRRFVGYLGQSEFWKKVFLPTGKTENEDKIDLLKELTETVKYLSKTKTGGLIVLHTNETDTTYSEVGTKLDAKVTAELLLTIFFPNTPLHDGAVIIKGTKIASAGALLPLTEDPKLSWKYGTRHRAAIGVTEVNECACIVVSEETGDISIALDGQLKKYESIVDFKNDLQQILKIEVEEQPKENLLHNRFLSLNFNKKDNK